MLRRPDGERRRLLEAIRQRIRGARPFRRSDPDAVWFRDHYYQAPAEIMSYLREVGVVLRDLHVADIGCGDGIMALGVARQGRPALLVGFDVNRTDADVLLERAKAERAAGATLPPNLEFRQSEPTELPAADGSFDVVYTWSAFEHIEDPTAVLLEINRVLRREGLLFLQLWPFYLSERGSHLWDWFPESFHHLLMGDDEIAAAMTRGREDVDFMTGYMLEEYQKLNRITLGDLQDALLAADFDIVRLDLLSHRVALEPELARRFRLADLGIAGVKLIARPRAASAGEAPVPQEVTDSEEDSE
jgi:ubiquinone/menaquinone biosynthesis C-methylase UbiE